MKLLILLSVLVVVKSAKLDGYKMASPSGPTLSPGGCPEGQVLHVDGTCVLPEVTRKVFVYTAPEQEIEYSGPPAVLPPPRVEHNIVFIRTPEYGQGPEPIIVPPPRQQHIVYVLNKQSYEDQRVIEVPAPPSTNPEVYFVNYDEGDNPTLPGGIDFQTALNSAVEADAQLIAGAAAGGHNSAVVGLGGHTGIAEGFGGFSDVDGGSGGHQDDAGSSEGQNGGFGGFESYSGVDGSSTSHTSFVGDLEVDGEFFEHSGETDGNFESSANGYTGTNGGTGFLVSHEENDDVDDTLEVSDFLQSDSDESAGFSGNVGIVSSDLGQTGANIGSGDSNSGVVSSVSTSSHSDNDSERVGYSITGVATGGFGGISGEGNSFTGGSSGLGTDGVAGDIIGNTGSLGGFNVNSGVDGDFNSITGGTNGAASGLNSNIIQVNRPSGLYSTP